MIRNSLKLLFVLLILGGLFVAGYSSDRGYRTLIYVEGIAQKIVPFHFPLLAMIDKVVNEIDPIRVLRRKEVGADQVVHVRFSNADLESMRFKKEIFIKDGFIRDKINNWRKAKLLHDGKWWEVGYKFHGTSVTPLKKGGVSYRFKHIKEDSYLWNMRQFNLISHEDDPGIVTIAINTIATEFNLISTRGRLVDFHANGASLGNFMLYEQPTAEWYEREHGLTNISVLKSTDDWDRKRGSHASDTDLFTHNKEVKSNSDDGAEALGALNILLQAVRKGEITIAKGLLDLDYLARFMALAAITNNSHPLTGDNLRYIYDSSAGHFKILFRAEANYLVPFRSDIENFNSSLFGYSEDSSAVNTNLFRLILQDKSFRHRRDHYLNQLVKDRDRYLSIADRVIKENWNILLVGSKPMRPQYYNAREFRKIFRSNVEWAEKYLNYSKVFVSVYKNTNGATHDDVRLSILNDSFHPIVLDGVSFNLDDGKTTGRQPLGDILIPSPRLDTDLKPVHKPHDVWIKKGSIDRLYFRNAIFQDVEIPDRHTYINYIANIDLFSDRKSFQSFKKNNIPVVTIGNKLVIEPGTYRVVDNLVSPRRYEVEIKPGVRFLIAQGKSVLIRGPLNAVGTVSSPIIVGRLKSNHSFGSFAVIAGSEENVRISNFKIQGGSEAKLAGLRFLGQLAIHGGRVELNKVTSRDSSSDDGVNIRHSELLINNSLFFNNKSDQVDLDFCNGIVQNSKFYHSKDLNQATDPNSDGLDISGSTIEIIDNHFSNFPDKGISIGEGSIVVVRNNSIESSRNGISLKDGSKAFLADNNFLGNFLDLSLYVKKNQYSAPTAYLKGSVAPMSRHVEKGVIRFVESQEEFQLEEAKFELR